MLRLSLICVGRAKASAERELAGRYMDRARLAGRPAGLSLDLIEIDESRARRAADRKAEEAKTFSGRMGAGGLAVALDETGRAIDSAGFAALIGKARDDGVPALVFVIGGPDGLDPVWRETAAHVVAFGTMTWPHQLVRIMAAEQLYRAVTILTGHPYHRA